MTRELDPTSHGLLQEHLIHNDIINEDDSLPDEISSAPHLARFHSKIRTKISDPFEQHLKRMANPSDLARDSPLKHQDLDDGWSRRKRDKII
mmetsp:Transcript_33760/g.52117  ORF Transcript_33760/g.52117 Transcript_33760/m.52117 type:complete len:92 (-) Transcript_33760:75-350(-)